MKMTFHDLRLIIQEELNNSILEDLSPVDLISDEQIEVMTHALDSMPKKKKKKKKGASSSLTTSSGHGGYIDDYYDDMIYTTMSHDEDDQGLHVADIGDPDDSTLDIDGPADLWDDDVDDSWDDMDLDLDD